MAEPRLTRKQQREHARQERLAREAQERARMQRSRRSWQLSGVVVLAAAVVIAAIAISSSGTSGLAAGSRAKQIQTSVRTLLAGVSQSGSMLGRPNAPVTMVYYGDLECPVCAAFTLQTLPSVIAADIRAGRLKIEYRSFETATPDKSTFIMQQAAALAAGQQNHMWDYVELFYHQQGREGSGYVTDGYLTGIAKQVPGLDISRWNASRHDRALAAEVSSEEQAAAQQGVRATPTLLIEGPRGRTAEAGIVPHSTLEHDIQSAL